ncbi:MAG: hypothetical protein AAF215_19875 [Cyanobacteria bacterium P01_A01_bin.123]
MKNLKSRQTETKMLTSKTIQELSEADLELIAGGKPKEDDDPVDAD